MELNLSTRSLVAGNVRAELARYHMTHKEIADYLNISLPTLRRKINGSTDFTVTEIASIASLLGIPTVTLLQKHNAVQQLEVA